MSKEYCQGKQIRSVSYFELIEIIEFNFMNFILFIKSKR